MAPEVKEIFIKGEENCDFNQFNPWKSDVYSFGITLLECCDLSISSKKSLEDKIKNAEKNYGEDFSNFIRILLTNDLKLRPDFIELEERVEYVKLFGKKQEKEENFQVERRENNANLAEKEANLSVSQEFELFLKEIGNNGEIDEVFNPLLN